LDKFLYLLVTLLKNVLCFDRLLDILFCFGPLLDMSLCLLIIGHVICFRPLLDMSFTFTFCWTCGFLSYFVGYFVCFRPSWFLLWSYVGHVSFFLLFIGYVIFLSSFVRDVVVCCGHQFDMAFAMTSDMVFAIALLYMVFAMILCWTWVLQ